MRGSVVHKGLVGALAAMAVALAGCGGAPPVDRPVAGNFVGEVEGTNALIAVVVGEDYAVAYVCDSEEIAQGFGGRIDGTSLSLGALQHTGKADVQVKGSTATGTVSIGGVPHRFTARTAPATAGYYRAHGQLDGRAVTAQWVVAADGRVRGAVIDRTTSGYISITSTGVHIEFDVLFRDVLIGDVRVPLSHITPIHIEHSVPFSLPVDVIRPGAGY